MHDLVIRNGTVIDGTGAAPRIADVAVQNGRIAAVGTVAEAGREELDATGLIVTPGFIDLHTHYDGQALWSPRLNPSSAHGVTTVIIGNCGVGFAPCRPQDRDLLCDTMEGVEDIPGTGRAFPNISMRWTLFRVTSMSARCCRIRRCAFSRWVNEERSASLPMTRTWPKLPGWCTKPSAPGPLALPRRALRSTGAKTVRWFRHSASRGANWSLPRKR
jgi:hypothetical protein